MPQRLLEPLVLAKTDMDIEPSARRRGTGARRRLSDGAFAALLLAGCCAIGSLMGALIPGNTLLPQPWRLVSSCVGWTYFTAWSISFYPQVISNWQRRSVEGLSFDFLALNLLGFVCYSVFNCVLYFGPHVRCEISPEAAAGCAAGKPPPRVVELNDVVFGLHAVALTLVTIGQCFVYPRGPKQRVSHATWAAVAGAPLLLATFAAVVAGAGERPPLLTYLSVVYAASFVKMGATLTKYIPQVVLNARRRSTVGWSIWNVVLDLTGGLLSLVQVVMLGVVTRRWGPVIGNPVKFGLGLSSLLFDLVFMTQHYCLFPGSGSPRALPGGSALPTWEAEADEESAAALPQQGSPPSLVRRASGGSGAGSEEEGRLVVRLGPGPAAGASRQGGGTAAAAAPEGDGVPLLGGSSSRLS